MKKIWQEILLRSAFALPAGIHRISKKLQFFSKWYYPVIRELATIINLKMIMPSLPVNVYHVLLLSRQKMQSTTC